MVNDIRPSGGPPDEAEVRRCLEQIIDPCSAASASPMNIVEMGLVRDIEITPDGDVNIELRLTSPSCYMVGYMAENATELISPLPGVRAVHVQADAGLDWDPDMISPAAAARRSEALNLFLSRPAPASSRAAS